MSNDPTTTPSGKAGRGRAASRRSATPYPGMMGDGTEEQNLDQVGDPSARIDEEEVDAAFATPPAKRPFLDKEKLKDAADKAKDIAADKISALTDRVNALREEVDQSTETARAWAAKQAQAAKQTVTRKPVLVVSASAGVALAVGLVAGFLIGRATADQDWD